MTPPPGEIPSEVAAAWARRRPPPGDPVDPARGSPTPPSPGNPVGAQHGSPTPPSPGNPVGAQRGSPTPATPATPHPTPTALALGDPAPHLPRALAQTGYAVTRWHRHLTRGQLCAPWPPSGPFGEVWVRMPRSALEAAMLLHAAAARVADGARIYLYGATNEGIRSAARHFPEGTEPPVTLHIKRRCRVLAATRHAPPPRPDGLDSWELRAPLDWGSGPRDWTFYPGVFACGRLDSATALLIDCLPALPAGARLLDFGAGTGIIAAAALERGAPGAEAVLLERDAIALVAASRNLPGATLVLGRGVATVPGPFDLIVSNPPIHAGSAQSLATVEKLVHEAATVLAPGGRLLIVAQRRLPIPRILERTYPLMNTIADRDSFRVWEAGRRTR